MSKPYPETCSKCGGVGWLPAASTLARKRRRAKVAQNVIAERMGITPQYLCDLENGRRGWNYELVEKFEKALNGTT